MIGVRFLDDNKIYTEFNVDYFNLINDQYRIVFIGNITAIKGFTIDGDGSKEIYSSCQRFFDWENEVLKKPKETRNPRNVFVELNKDSYIDEKEWELIKKDGVNFVNFDTVKHYDYGEFRFY